MAKNDSLGPGAARKSLSRVNSVLTVASSELKNFWGGAGAGVTLLVFLGLGGFFFYNSIVAYVLQSLESTAKGWPLDASLALFSQGLNNIPLGLMLVTPMVTLRSLSPHRRGGGLDFWQTLPLNATDIVAGQFLAAAVSLVFLSFLGLVPFAFLLWAGVGDPGVLLSFMVGLGALAVAFAALGLLASAMFPSPVGAGLTTLGFLGLMWVLGWASPYGQESWAALWQGLAFAPRLTRFALGLIDVADLLFFLTVTIMAFFLACSFLKARGFSGAD